MASDQGRMSAAYRAGGEAQRLDHGWIGTEHVLLALFDEPSPATEALEELGVTRERVEQATRAMGRGDPPAPRYDPAKGLSPTPAWYSMTGCAKGLALAAGRSSPGPEHFLLAMVYGEHGVAELLHGAGASEQALLEALARRGVPVPAVDPPVYRPMRGHHRVVVTEAELMGVLDVLRERHPPGSEWRWGFNWLTEDPEKGRPRRAWVGGEEGIDLEDALATARARAAASG
jgi:hypothetical protein